MIFIAQVSYRSGSRMTAEFKTAYHYSENIFLVSIPIKAQLQRVVVITKLKTGFCIVITRYVFIIIQKPVFESQRIAASENVRIVVAKKIDLIFSPVKIDTVL